MNTLSQHLPFQPHPYAEHFPSPMRQDLLPITRLDSHIDQYPEIKDPSIVLCPDGTAMMYASIGSSVTQRWVVGRFVSEHGLDGPWQELSPTQFIGITGPQLCAPAVLYEQKDNQPFWTMYIQTACFEENGVIASATSTDGETFSGVSASLITRETIDDAQKKVIGVYDAGISEITMDQEDYLVMLFSGYRRVGCGDIYLSYKKKHAPDNDWTKARNVLSQEDVPFHNHPDYEFFEWGLEGAKLVQLTPQLFLMIGVCFLPMPHGYDGQRQRIFFALSDRIDGPYVPLHIPLYTPAYAASPAEQGHPELLIHDNSLWIIYQERKGDGMPWYLCYATYDLSTLTRFFAGAYADPSLAFLHTPQYPQIQGI